MKNGLNKFKISHVKPNFNNFFNGTNLSKKQLFELIDVVRNTQNAKSITDAKDFELKNYSTLSRLSIGLATTYQQNITGNLYNMMKNYNQSLELQINKEFHKNFLMKFLNENKHLKFLNLGLNLPDLR